MISDTLSKLSIAADRYVNTYYDTSLSELGIKLHALRQTPEGVECCLQQEGNEGYSESFINLEELTAQLDIYLEPRKSVSVRPFNHSNTANLDREIVSGKKTSRKSTVRKRKNS